MKKTVNLAFFYAIMAMVGGVFYREFTKYSGFEGRTALGFVHTHLFMLGMLMFLAVAFAIKLFSVDKSKRYKAFMWSYNAGLVLTVIMLLVRGWFQVTQTAFTRSLNGMISGLAGMGHIFLGIGIILFFLALKERTE